MNMIGSTFLAAAFLIVIGLGGYLQGDVHSLTALIPCGFGAVLLLLGLLAQQTERKWVFILAIVVAILGLVGAGMRLPKSAAAISASSSAIPLAFFCQSIMALVCLIYALIGIRSMILQSRESKISHDRPEVID